MYFSTAGRIQEKVLRRIIKSIVGPLPLEIPLFYRAIFPTTPSLLGLPPMAPYTLLAFSLMILTHRYLTWGSCVRL